MITKGKIRISERALLQRINRHLAEEKPGLVVKKARIFARPHLGVYYLLDTKAGRVVEYNFDLGEEGRKLDVFKSWEVLVKG